MILFMKYTKIIAKEYLYFLCFLIGGIIIIRALGAETPSYYFRKHFEIWLAGRLSFYFIFLFIRSIVWSIKQIRKK